MKMAVIIQGPVVTFGDGPNNALGGFDATQTILTNIDRLKKRNIDYVISTWRPSDPREKSVFKALQDHQVKMTLRSAPQVADPYNAFKQHYSMLLGAKWLLQHGSYDYIVKIRTDMVIPAAFWDWLIASAEKDPQKLLISELYRDHPYYMGDFLIGGDIKTFSDYIISVLNHKTQILFPLSAFDDGVKYMDFLKYVPAPRKLWRIIDMYYHYVFNRHKLQLDWNAFVTNELIVMPFKYWKEIVWRGKKMTEVIDPKPFLFKATITSFVGNSIWENWIFLTKGYLRLVGKRNKDRKTELSLKIAEFFEFLLAVIGTLENTFKKSLTAKKPRPMILGRYSCIGRDTVRLKSPDNTFNSINQQKVRVDLFMEWIKGIVRPDTKHIKKYFVRSDVFPLAENQELLPWLAYKGDFEYMLMDSFCELTDKKFTHVSEHWSFCCHYSDLDTSGDFLSKFVCEDVVPISQLYSSYLAFFDWFEAVYPGKHIYFLLAPTTLDSRSIYRERAEAIKHAITKIAVTKSFLHPIEVPDTVVKHDKTDTFPYHFSQDTYFAFLKKWDSIRSSNQKSIAH